MIGNIFKWHDGPEDPRKRGFLLVKIVNIITDKEGNRKACIEIINKNHWAEQTFSFIGEIHKVDLHQAMFVRQTLTPYQEPNDILKELL